MIILTFDDALLDTYEVAFPIMEQAGVKGVLFVPTDVVSGGKPFRENAVHMNIEQIREMYQAGWEIGSHSHTHPRFDKLHFDMAKWELTISKMHLEKWGFKPVSFAFPYGHGLYTDDQVTLAHKIYKHVRTVMDLRNPNKKLIRGLPLDYGYPPRFPFLAKLRTTYVFHTIKDPAQFKEWLNHIAEKITTFQELDG